MIPTLPPLCGGSQQRSGRTHTFIARIARQVRTTHAPLAANGRPMRSHCGHHGGHRHGASLSATDATNPAARRRGSNHPDRRMSGWNRVLPAGENRIANGWGLLRRGVCADGEPRIGSSGQTGSGKRYQRLSAPQDLRSCRMCSSRTPNLGCAWVAHRDAGFSDTACT